MKIDHHDIQTLIAAQKAALGQTASTPLATDITSEITPAIITEQPEPSPEGLMDTLKFYLNDILEILRMVDEVVGIFTPQDPESNNKVHKFTDSGAHGEYIVKTVDNRPISAPKKGQILRPEQQETSQPQGIQGLLSNINPENVIKYVEQLQQLFGADATLNDLKKAVENNE